MAFMNFDKMISSSTAKISNETMEKLMASRISLGGFFLNCEIENGEKCLKRKRVSSWFTQRRGRDKVLSCVLEF
ncbi:hypothetical protein Csa_020455 [Cucumis sativus]|uniref:Uncharacterized protein n=1 Tax=Cucumis sativus TaxID=3659 RepID=A0A0A0K8G7_CUCSA|nr:hypothetical protein Csa_020455 [Cucumis sativus]